MIASVVNVVAFVVVTWFGLCAVLVSALWLARKDRQPVSFRQRFALWRMAIRMGLHLLRHGGRS